MKRFFPLIIVIISGCKNDHKNQMNLEKFSYYLFAKTGNKSITEATGFFISKGNDLFFVSAAHVLLSWDFKNNVAAQHIVDTFYLRLYRKDNNEQVLIEVPVSDLRNAEKKGFAFEVPDFTMIKMNELKKDFLINSVNEYFTDYPINDTITKVEIWGFPLDDSINDIEPYISRKPSYLEGYLKDPFSKELYWDEFDKSDQINYNCQIIEGNCQKGLSGAPVFLTVNGKNVFGGLTSLGDSVDKKITAVRPEYILNALKTK